MNYQHIKEKDIKENKHGSLFVQNLFPQDGYDKFSVAKIKIFGEQKFGYSTERDAIYYVLEGNGIFHIEKEKVEVKKGDLIIIPKGVKYKDSGNLTLLSVSAPKFDRRKWVECENI